jgi:iron complex outermembrane receptor protein
MNSKFFAGSLCVTGLVSLGAIATAPAQTAAVQATATEAESGDTLSEIIVTARRFEERAQDVPISMTVFNQQALSDRNIVTAGDLAIATPSLAVDNEFGQDVTSFALRGFVQQLNTTPSVAVYFADAVEPRGGAVGEPAGSGVPPGSFFDLQNVQVLKGPQGTLFGRNTDGGAVLLVPTKPTSEFGGYLEGAYGNFSMGEVQGALNVPLGDNVRMRFSVNHETRNGYENNITGIGPQDFANIDFTAARYSLVVDITPDLENYTVASYNLSVNNGLLPQLFACNPAEGLAALLCPPLQAQVQKSGDFAVSNNLPGAESYLKQYQAINTTIWHVTDSLTVKNVANYGLLVTKLDSALFGAYLGGGGIFGSPFLTSTSSPTPEAAQTTDQYTWSDELQLSGKLFDNKLSWQGGGYVERSGPHGDLTGTRSGSFLACPDLTDFICSGPGLVDINTSTVHYNDQAVFGQVTYAILEQLKVTAGLRYTSDNTTATIHQTNYAGFPFFPPAGTFTTITCQVTAPGVTPANGCTQMLEENSHAPTYLLGLDYNPIQDVLLYAKYARGYRQGSVAAFALEGFQVYAPEFVNSFELGEKTTFSGPISGTFDVTGHYNAFSDQQLLAGFISGGVPSAGIANAGKSRIWGVEVESSLVPVKPLTLALSYSYLNTELQSAFVESPPPGAQVIFPTTVGGDLPFSPKNKLSSSATYRLPVPDDIGKLSLSANYTYTSSLLVSKAAPASTASGLPETPDPLARIGAYGLLGMNVHWDNILRSPIDGELFATNLTNRLYYTNVTGLWTSPFGLASRYPGEPRMYGIRVQVHFGGK